MNLSREIFYHTGIAYLYAAGETIFSAGEAAHEMYLILEGSIEVYNAGLQCGVLGPGQILDELAVLGGGQRGATAIAREGAVLIPIDARRFEQIVRDMPPFALSVIRSLAERLGRSDPPEPLLERSIAA